MSSKSREMSLLFFLGALVLVLGSMYWARAVLMPVEQKMPVLFCIGFVPPGGLFACRHLSQLLRSRRSELNIVVGHWGLHEKGHNDRETLLAAGASLVAASLVEARDQITQALHPHVKH